MRSNIRYSTNEILEYIELYLDGISFRALREDYDLDLNESTFRLYLDKYLKHGTIGLLWTYVKISDAVN